MGRCIRMQRRHNSTHLMWEDVRPRRRPLAQLDKRCACPFHTPDKKPIPPQTSRTLIVSLPDPRPNPYRRHAYNDWHEYDDEVDEAKACEDRLDDVSIGPEIDGTADFGGVSKHSGDMGTELFA